MLETELTESMGKLNLALGEGESFDQEISPSPENNIVSLHVLTPENLLSDFESPHQIKMLDKNVVFCLFAKIINYMACPN